MILKNFAVKTRKTRTLKRVKSPGKVKCSKYAMKTRMKKVMEATLIYIRVEELLWHSWRSPDQLTQAV